MTEHRWYRTRAAELAGVGALYRHVMGRELDRGAVVHVLRDGQLDVEVPRFFGSTYRIPIAIVPRHYEGAPYLVAYPGGVAYPVVRDDRPRWRRPPSTPEPLLL